MAALAAAAGALARAMSRSRSKSRKPKSSVDLRAALAASAARSRSRTRRGRSRTRASTQSPVRNDGQGNSRMSSSHGRSVSKLSSKAEAKIRASLTPIDTLIRQDVGLDAYDNVDQMAWSQYRVFEIGNSSDVRKIIEKSLGENPDYDLESYIKDYSMQIKLVNQMNTVVNIRTYEYISRNDLPYGIYASTQSCVADGFTKESPHEVTFKTIGGTLFQNSPFCTYYKIVKVRNVQLAPGKELVLNLSHQKGHKINALLYESDIVTRRNYTRGIVVQYVGSPCTGPLAEPAGSNLAAVGPFKVAWALFRRFHFMNLNPHKGATYLEDNIPFVAGGTIMDGIPKWGAGGHPGRIMNQESGVPEPTIQA